MPKVVYIYEEQSGDDKYLVATTEAAVGMEPLIKTALGIGTGCFA